MNQEKNIKTAFLILSFMTVLNVVMLIFNYKLWHNNQQILAKIPVSASDQVDQSSESEQNLLSVSESPTPNQNISVKNASVKNDSVITIKAVGDLVPGTSYSKTPNIQDKMKMFDGVQAQLKGADFLFGNLETTLTNHPYSTKDTSQRMMFAFRTAPAYRNFLKKVGFDIFNIANNHTFDYGEKGLADTLANLQAVGIKHIGEKDQILYLEQKGLTIAWIGFSYFDQHNNINHLDQAIKLVEEAQKNADFVVISAQGGAEGSDQIHVRNATEIFYSENRGNMLLFSRKMIDHGADLIIGHGPHVVRGMELYKGKLIAYSLGNFVGDGALGRDGILANSLILEVTLNSQGDLVKGKIIPVKINEQGFPFYDAQFSTVKMIQSLVKADFPDTNLIIKDTGELTF
jgi:hypothetical protein